MPLTRPTAIARAAISRKTAGSRSLRPCDSSAVRTAAPVIVHGIERSMPPVRMHRLWPNAAIPIVAL